MVSRLIDRGNEIVRCYPTVTRTDVDGNEVAVPADTPYKRRATVAEDRQADAELTGQVSNKVVRLAVRNLPHADSWSGFEFRGELWDLAQPPHWSDGVSRAIRHVELVLRSRNSIPFDSGGL
ncbi:hypothetical protein [Brevibacterium album]|uniref:hypothetical protein n=1 Tax=Brevibacterium album TaxID=417948 RepID=UPI0004151C73|nr:hypothetical protein [Brevibacterium album]